MICDAGDVVLVPFPFVDMAVVKRRPALVISKRRFNEANGQSLLAMITTASRSAWPSDIPIRDLSAAGLPRDSIIRWKVFTLPNENFLRRLGKLGPDDMPAFFSSVTATIPIR